VRVSRVPPLPTLLLVAALACTPRPARTPQPAGPGPSLRVMTYNVNYGIAGDAETIALIRDSHADVVFLQETSAGWQQALDAAVAGVYPQRAFHHWAGAGGLGVLSRVPIEDGGLLLPEGEGWFPGWRLVVRTSFGPVQVLSVHLHPPVSEGGSFVAGYFTTASTREAEIARFYAHLDPALPTLVVGDFNEADGRAVRYLTARGLRSALPEFHPKAITWTWPTSVMTLRDRLDHVFYDARLEPLSAEVLAHGQSDHFPIVAVLAPARR
jgi:endonuclease/exonuclease/phosphatase (EEP) superfamily protein YafD